MPPPTELRRADHASRHLALGDCVDWVSRLTTRIL
jgi:hypothetical protein